MRGANCTSLDAAMLGLTADSQRILVLIEWKYTETYGRRDLYEKSRSRVYDDLIMHPESPIDVSSPEILYFEPFYQLMRQTLLGWKMVEHGDYGADAYVHIHVIPRENHKLRRSVNSPHLRGKDMTRAWKSVLVESDSYAVVTPTRLLKAVCGECDYHSFWYYLNRRYLTGSTG